MILLLYTQSEKLYMVIRVLYLIVAAIGIVGDTTSIVVILSNRRMRKTYTNLLLLNQSLIDLSTAVTVSGKGQKVIESVTIK